MEMNEQLAQKIVDVTDSWCWVDMTLHSKETPRVVYRFFDIDKDTMMALRENFHLGKLNKTFNSGSVSYSGENFSFCGVAQCRIVGYREEKVEEHLKHIPIYDCTK